MSLMRYVHNALPKHIQVTTSFFQMLGVTGLTIDREFSTPKSGRSTNWAIRARKYCPQLLTALH